MVDDLSQTLQGSDLSATEDTLATNMALIVFTLIKWKWQIILENTRTFKVEGSWNVWASEGKDSSQEASKPSSPKPENKLYNTCISKLLILLCLVSPFVTEVCKMIKYLDSQQNSNFKMCFIPIPTIINGIFGFICHKTIVTLQEDHWNQFRNQFRNSSFLNQTKYQLFSKMTKW